MIASVSGHAEAAEALTMTYLHAVLRTAFHDAVIVDELGAAYRNRTDDLRITSASL